VAGDSTLWKLSGTPDGPGTWTGNWTSSRCWAVHSSSKRLFDPRDTDQAIGPFLIGKLARDGVEVPTSVFYGEYLSRPTNMTTTPAPEQMTSPFRDRSALVIGVPLGRTDTHSSAPARLDLAVEAPTSVIYGENHSRPDQHDHSAAERRSRPRMCTAPLPSTQRAHHWCPSTAYPSGIGRG
jgi:hypothetical protein